MILKFRKEHSLHWVNYYYYYYYYYYYSLLLLSYCFFLLNFSGHLCIRRPQYMLREEAKKLYFKYLSPDAPLKIKYQVTTCIINKFTKVHVHQPLILIYSFSSHLFIVQIFEICLLFLQIIFNIQSHLIEIESTLKAADAHSEYIYSKTLHILVKLSKIQCSSVKLFSCRIEQV